MMLASLFSFLGGGVFRMIWGELSSWLTKKQDHANEMERLKFQADREDATFDRQQAAIKNQHSMGVEIIHVQAQAATSTLETQAWLEGVKATTILTGVKWVDAWNQTIRPFVATWAIVMITLAEFSLFTMSDDAMQIACAALGLYLADRTLAKRGK
jgi:hypothetical protein